MPLPSVLVAVLPLALAAAAAAPAAELPPEEAYVTVQDGHLSTGGERVRFWAVIGKFPYPPRMEDGDTPERRAAKTAAAYAASEAVVQRFVDLGFNMSRFWRTCERDYVKGDGSYEDVVDHFVAEMKRRGLRIWVPAIARADAGPDDVEAIDDPATAGAWRAAMAEAREKRLPYHLAQIWDPRLEAVQVAAMTRRATHLNRHTGLRWCDDPVFAIWELSNEEWWMSKMVGGRWRRLPAFFQDSLAALWHGYLRAKYGDEASLVRAWGFLLPGESLERGSVAVLPLRGAVDLGGAGMDAQARRQLEAAGGADLAYGRDDVTWQRGADVIEFFLGLQLAHKRRLESALESLGRSTALSPTVYDTGIGYEAQSQYLHQQADAVAHDAYINGTTKNRLNQRWPWYSGVEEPPRIAHDVPWLEHNKVAGKPFLCYETQIQQPAMYRAEFPLRLLALASIQDWDAVCWHYWGPVPDIAEAERPFDKPMDITTGGHPQGYHYTYDAVQNAVMKAAGLAFRAFALRPAPEPTTFVYGRRALYDPDSMDYAGSYGRLGLDMLPTTYAHGVRILIDPTLDDRPDDPLFLKDDGSFDRRRYDSFVRTGGMALGPVLPLNHDATPNRLRSTEEILFDWRRGIVKLDSPALAAVAGFLGRTGHAMRFANGVELVDVRVHNPEGIAHPVPHEDAYAAFALVAADGRALAESDRLLLALTSTSFNSGFRLGGPAGELPVLEARVSATVRSPALAGRRYVLRDWHLQPIGEGTVGPDGALAVPADRPVWTIELTR